ncbi:putative hydrolase PNKD [Lamellibrachia satsuma]|nr:putative hydrolase PNKD [Lamellibrachia satsuma]
MPTRGQPSDCILSFLYYAARRMSSWNPLFRIGYYFYTKTHIGYWSFMRIIKKAHVKFDKGGHSTAPPTVWNGLRIVPIPIAFDNYGYLVVDERTNTSVLIDPSDPLVVQEFLERENTTPVAILATHRHWDHTAGNYELKKLYPGLQVYGGHISPIQGITDIVHDGDHLTFGSLSFCVFHTPGHTMEHVVYILDGAPFGMSPSIFSGDHLFLAGIGRLFEGTAKTMMESLERLCALPDDTLLWPGQQTIWQPPCCVFLTVTNNACHEYALDNIGYAFYLEPENEAVRVRRHLWFLCFPQYTARSLPLKGFRF